MDLIDHSLKELFTKMDQQVLYTINQLTGFSLKEVESVLHHFETRQIKKRTNIIKAGAIANEVYFIIKGCMRLFYEKEGLDISAYFFTENMFAGAYDSFSAQRPSRHSIEAIEDCYVLVITFGTLQQLLTDFPKMNAFVLKVLEERFISLHELFTSQILDSPEERYLNLLQHLPDLLQRIPQHQIATFLGVTPVSLSRIRNRILRK